MYNVKKLHRYTEILNIENLLRSLTNTQNCLSLPSFLMSLQWNLGTIEKCDETFNDIF